MYIWRHFHMCSFLYKISILPIWKLICHINQRLVCHMRIKMTMYFLLSKISGTNGGNTWCRYNLTKIRGIITVVKGLLKDFPSVRWCVCHKVPWNIYFLIPRLICEFLVIVTYNYVELIIWPVGNPILSTYCWKPISLLSSVWPIRCMSYKMIKILDSEITVLDFKSWLLDLLAKKLGKDT